MLNERFVSERSFHVVFFLTVTFSQIIKALDRSWRSFVLADNFFKTISRRRMFFLLVIKHRHVEFMLGEVLNAFGQTLCGLRRVGRFWVIRNHGLEIALGDFGIFLVAVNGRELVQVGLSKPQDDKRNIFVG